MTNSNKELDEIKLSISFTERQLDDMKPGDEIELGLTDEAKQLLNALIEKKVRDAQIDVLQRLRGIMGKYKGNGIFDKKMFELIAKEIEKLQDNQVKEGKQDE